MIRRPGDFMTALKDLLYPVLLGSLLATAPAQTLELDVVGGSLPGDLTMRTYPGIYPFELIMIVPSTTAGPTPIGIFDPGDPREDKAFYRAANKLHYKTREWIVAEQLTFREGELLRGQRLEESERLLRHRQYLALQNKLSLYDDVLQKTHHSAY